MATFRRWAWWLTVGCFAACGGRTGVDDGLADDAEGDLGGWATVAGAAASQVGGHTPGSRSGGGGTGGVHLIFPTGGKTRGIAKTGGVGPRITFGGTGGYPRPRGAGGTYARGETGTVRAGGSGGVVLVGSRAGSGGAPRGGASGRTNTGGLNLDGGIPWDALPLPDSGPVATCAQCVRSDCRTRVDTCAASSVCLEGIVCGISCSMGDMLCVARCFSSGDRKTTDMVAALTAFEAITCVAAQCGEDCLSGLSM